MKLKKILSLIITAAMVTTMFAGCGNSNSEAPKTDGSSTDAPKTDASSTDGSSTDKKSSGGAKSIYFLNFKPEIAEKYEAIAKDYEAETGVKVNVVTAAAGTYEQTLKSEIAKKDAPTIFQMNGPVGYQSWKDYCADIKDSEIYSHLTDKSMAITDGDGVYGIPYAVEGYGIIYNNAIMSKYFALPNKTSPANSMEDIKDFASLKAVVEDMTANKESLAIQGVFSSTSLTPGEDWRWQTHTANLPMYYEFKENTAYESTIFAALDAKEVTFKYSDNFKNIFDLYIENSSTEKGLLGSKTVDDSMAEFALGKTAMVQNGNWGWGQISGVAGNVVNPDDIKFLPIYTGMPDEQTQGICVGTENYFAINSKVSEEQQKASLDFLTWLFSSEKGKAYVKNDLGFISPFDTFTDAEKPEDPLAKEVLNWINKDGITSVPWTFAGFPSQTFKDNVGASLLEYAQGTKTFDDVKSVLIEQWQVERAK